MYMKFYFQKVEHALLCVTPCQFKPVIVKWATSRPPDLYTPLVFVVFKYIFNLIAIHNLV